jgi:hypothetical protein
MHPRPVALKCCPQRGIRAGAATNSGIQVQVVSKDCGVHTDFSGIDIDTTAEAVDTDAGVSVARS